jgi:hypothetical protein
VASSPNRAACPLLAAHLTTAAAFSILEAGGQQLSLDWSLGVESSCHEELTVIPVTVLLQPSVNISLTQVSFAMYHTDSHIITQAKQSIRNLAVLVLSSKTSSLCLHYTAETHNTENSKKIFPEKELPGHSSNYHIYMSVSDLYIPTIDLPILRQENMWTDPGNILIAYRHMNGEIGTEAAQFPEKEYINGIFVAL